MSDPLHVVDMGDGPAVVLLHAFPCDGRMWDGQATALRDAGFRVIVPDLPGFGESALLDTEVNLDVVADSVIGMLAERDLDRCVLGGISLGGYVAMAILRKRPDLAAALILCDTKATADGEAARANREHLAAMCVENPHRTGRILEQAVLAGLVGDTTRAERPQVLEQVRGWLYEARPETVAWYQRAMAVRPDSVSALTDCDAPVLILWGDEDTLSPRSEQDVMLAALANSELLVIPGAGHLSNVEDPGAVTSALRTFLHSLSS